MTTYSPIENDKFVDLRDIYYFKQVNPKRIDIIFFEILFESKKDVNALIHKFSGKKMKKKSKNTLYLKIILYYSINMKGKNLFCVCCLCFFFTKTCHESSMDHFGKTLNYLSHSSEYLLPETLRD